MQASESSLGVLDLVQARSTRLRTPVQKSLRGIYFRGVLESNVRRVFFLNELTKRSGGSTSRGYPSHCKGY